MNNYRPMRSNTEPYFEYSVRCEDKLAIGFIKNISTCCGIYRECIVLATLKPDEGFTEEAVEKINDDLTEFINMLSCFNSNNTKFITSIILTSINETAENDNGVKMKPFELSFGRSLRDENRVDLRITFDFETPLARIVKEIISNILSADIDDSDEGRLMKLVTG